MPVSSMEARTNRKGIMVGNHDSNGSRGAAEPDCCGPRHRSQTARKLRDADADPNVAIVRTRFAQTSHSVKARYRESIACEKGSQVLLNSCFLDPSVSPNRDCKSGR